jgi:hypothetical protein
MTAVNALCWSGRSSVIVATPSATSYLIVVSTPASNEEANMDSA